MPHVGLLLRLFSHWYDLDVIEEDAFLKWKEDISHNFPGKGKALFQVNTVVCLCFSQETFCHHYIFGIVSSTLSGFQLC